MQFRLTRSPTAAGRILAAAKGSLGIFQHDYHRRAACCIALEYPRLYKPTYSLLVDLAIIYATRKRPEYRLSS